MSYTGQIVDINNKYHQTVVQIDPATGEPAVSGAMGIPRPASRPTLITAQTSSTGTNWVAFPSTACRSLDLINTAVASTSPSTIPAAVDIRWRYVSTSVWETVRAGTSTLIFVNANANEVEIQRADGSNSQITVMARAYA